MLPGDPHTRTGGYIYDRRIAVGLRERGWTVAVHSLSDRFPWPTPTDLEGAAAMLQALPDDVLVLIDGLALGAMPEVALNEAKRLRLIGLVHHPLAAETRLDAARAAALLASERRALAAVRRVVVTSHATARALAAYQVEARRIAVVEPGTDPAPLAQGSSGDDVALLCVGALVPRKGHDVLIEALAPLTDLRWHLRCAGSLTRDRDRAWAAYVRERIAAARLEARVSLLGELDEPALAHRYDVADVFVLPTRLEGYGMALAEALARGLPVVSTQAGAVPDTVPSDAGLLVPAGDVVALREALGCVIGDNRRRQQLRAGAQQARSRLPTWTFATQRMVEALTR